VEFRRVLFRSPLAASPSRGATRPPRRGGAARPGRPRHGDGPWGPPAAGPARRSWWGPAKSGHLGRPKIFICKAGPAGPPGPEGPRLLRDIREPTDDQAAYAEELRRRWGGLLSYRYIGRRYANMDVGPVDDTVTLRRDMRNATGGILLAVLGIASPEGGGMSDLEAVPNPV